MTNWCVLLQTMCHDRWCKNTEEVISEFGNLLWFVGQGIKELCMKSNSGVYVFGVHASFCYRGKGCGFWIGHPWNGTTILLLRTDREVLPAYESSGCHGPLTHISHVLWKFLLKILKCWVAVLRRLLVTMSSIKKSWYIYSFTWGKCYAWLLVLKGKSYLKFFFIKFYLHNYKNYEGKRNLWFS